LDWYILSNANYIPWSSDLLLTFSLHWNWINISLNTSIPWTDELIRDCYNYINWFDLSSNESVPWDINLINKYRNIVSWNCLSSNEGVAWSIELYEEFENELDNWWTHLSDNNGFMKKINNQLLSRLLIMGYLTDNSCINKFMQDPLYDYHLMQEIFKFT